MAPPKTLIVSQSPQQQQVASLRDQGEQAPQAGSKQAVKPRKRRAKPQQQGHPSASQQQIPDGWVEQKLHITNNSNLNLTKLAATINGTESNINSIKATASNKRPVGHTAVSIEKTIQKQQNNQVPSLVKEQPSLDKKTIAAVANTVIVKHDPTSEEADDIDAGIELDGSSNSGSSVKDVSEDQVKSNSVSPVMAQSNLVNVNSTATKHAVEVAPIEQMAGALCTDVSPASKKIATTKQQLTENQQVIDADEQQLQQKLQNKQRKSSLQDGSHNNSTSSPAQVSSPSSFCKICEQHVYQMERMLAEKSVYHKSCFRCYQCKIQLRVDNYSSHEGQVYCKAHHRQIFQPKVKLDSEDDVDIVAKSKILKRQMIICENQPAELPKDVVRSDTKVDDGIDQLNLNLNNILEKFEKGATNNGDEGQPSSAGVVIDKPSFNIKKTLMAFESRSNNPNEQDDVKRHVVTERPVVKKLSNLNGFFDRQNSQENEPQSPSSVKPLAVRRSESLMLRLKKYESRIAGEQLADDDNSDEDANVSNLESESGVSAKSNKLKVPKKLTSIDLSSLKNQWENGDINKRGNLDEDEDNVDSKKDSVVAGDITPNGNSPSAEKNEELLRIRQQLARKKLGESGSVKNIYENAIKEAQLQQQASRRDSSDLSALNGFSTSTIQKQLLQNSNSNISQNVKTPTTPNRDHFQLKFNNKANKLKERFELGLITNGSHDDSDQSDTDEAPAMTKLEQIRQEKLEDLSVFTEGEIKAREARNMFQQIDRRLSAENGNKQPVINSRSLASISASMRNKLLSEMSPDKHQIQSNNINNNNHHHEQNHNHQQNQNQPTKQPIRLTNNVRT